MPNSSDVKPPGSELDQKDQAKKTVPMQVDSVDNSLKPYYQNLSKKQTMEVQNQHLKKMLAVQQSKTGMSKKQ